MRGFAAEALAEGCGLVDYAAVVDTLLADGRAVLDAPSEQRAASLIEARQRASPLTL